VLIAGQAEHGLSPGCWPNCVNAVAAAENSVVRISGVTLGGTVQTSSGASVQFPTLADPTLHILGQVGPGENVTFRATAPLGSSAQLLMGRFPALVPVPGALEDVLVQVIRVFEMGPVGPNGVAGFNFVLPAFATSGSTLMAQARVTMPDGTTRFSNSVAVIVR
jgi:hypothetical protein